MCNEEEYNDMEKLEGHLCQPIMPWLKKRGIEGKFGWNAKTACKPEREKEVRKIREALKKCNERIWKKAMKKREAKGGAMKTLKEELLTTSVRRAVLEAKAELIWKQEE